jgi:hypothetical protein
MPWKYMGEWRYNSTVHDLGLDGVVIFKLWPLYFWERAPGTHWTVGCSAIAQCILSLHSLRILENWYPCLRKFNSCSEVLCVNPSAILLILYFSQFSRYFFQRNMMRIVKSNIAVIGIYDNYNT